MKLLRLTVLLSFTTFIFFSCQQEETQLIQPDLSVASVRSHFDELKNSQNGRISNPLEIVWDDPLFQQLTRGEVIFFPVASENDRRYQVEDHPEEYDATHLSYAFSYMENDSIQLELVEFIVTSPDSLFTGMILVKDWFGSLKHAISYENGGYAGYADGSSVSEGRIECWEITYKYCTVRESGPDDCWDPEIHTFCITFDDAYIMSDTMDDYEGGGRGGGSIGMGGGSGAISCDDGYDLINGDCVVNWENWIANRIEEMQTSMDCAKLKSSQGQRKTDIWEFYNKYRGWTKDEIFHERDDQYIYGVGPFPGGPHLNFRYVKDPLNSNIIIDMRHLLIVGEYGRAIGESVEYIQWLNSQESAFDDQDYYSNELGYRFYQEYGEAIDHSSDNIVDFLITFLHDLNFRNSISTPARCN